MTPGTAAATRIIADVTRDQPRGLYLLAVHASLPAAVNAALLHHLRDNFLLDGPPTERLPVTPGSEASLARLLLSPLFSEVDSDLYEMVPAVRAVLLDELSRLHGGERLAEVAALLERYTVQASPWVDRPELQWAQRVSARVVSDPAAVDEWLAQAGTSENTGLDDRWFVAMRARLDRDRELADAASRRRHGSTPEVPYRAIIDLPPSGETPRAAFRIMSGGLCLTSVSDSASLSFGEVIALLHSRRDVNVIALLASGQYDETLVVGRAPEPDEPLFLVTAMGAGYQQESVQVTGVGAQIFRVSGSPRTFAQSNGVLIDEDGQLVGLTVQDSDDRDGRPEWTAVNIDVVIEWLASDLDPRTIADTVQTPQDAALCMRLAEETLRVGNLDAALGLADLAQSAAGGDAELGARILLVRARVARLTAGDLSLVEAEAQLLFDRLPADSETGRTLAREIVAFVGGGEPPGWLPPRLTVLIGRFDAIGERNSSMAAADVVAALPADLTAEQVAELQVSRSPGARLLAAARLQAVPDPAQLWWLVAHIDPNGENPDVGYQAASALRAAAEHLPDEHLHDLELSLIEARLVLANRHGSARATIVDEAIGLLARRQAEAESSANPGWENFHGLADLNARYIAVRRIGISLSGRDVIVARELTGGALVVLRLGRDPEEGVNAAVAAAIGGAPNRYVTGPVEWGHDFEVHEYIADGSLADLRQRRRPAWPTGQVESALVGLLEAVSYLHGRRVIHRNISPSSVLVRSERPLELVLTSLDHAVMVGDPRVPTARLRPAYTAPEMAAGTASTAVDWWSVGIVLFDLLTGRNPFQRPDRSWWTGGEIVRHLTIHDIDLTPVEDRRWQMLLRGLLTRDPKQRWGAPEIRRWLAR